MKHKIIEDLHYQSTWRLTLFSFCTLGVYVAYYIKRQSKVINEAREGGYKITSLHVKGIMFFSYISAIFSFGSIMQSILASGSPDVFYLFSRGGGIIYYFIVVAWGFESRERVSEIIETNRSEGQIFSGLLTLFLTPYSSLRQ